MAMIDLPQFNRNIRAEMVRGGLNQTALAEHLGITQSTLSRRLTGDADWSISEVYQLADALGVTVSSLLPELLAAS